jgi:hypothetical protein
MVSFLNINGTTKKLADLLAWFGRFLLFIHHCTLKQHFRPNIKDSNKIKQGAIETNLV